MIYIFLAYILIGLARFTYLTLAMRSEFCEAIRSHADKVAVKYRLRNNQLYVIEVLYWIIISGLSIILWPFEVMGDIKG